MDTFTIWRIEGMINEIDDMASKVSEHESEYSSDEFEILIDALCRARKSLNEMLWVI